MSAFKIVYIAICSLLLFCLITCFIECLRRKTHLFNVIGNIQIASILLIISNLYAINISNFRVAQIFFALSFSILLVTVIIVLRLLDALESNRHEHKSEKIGKYIFFGLAVVDIILMFIKPDYYFTIEPFFVDGKFYIWKLHFKKFFIIHQLINYSFSLKILVRLVEDCIKNQKFYRKKFTGFLVLFTVAQVCNLVFDLFVSVFIYDFTPITYGVISVYSFFFAAFSVPKAVRDDMLSIASETISDAVICFDYKGKCLYENNSARRIYTPGVSKWIDRYLNSDEDSISCEEKIEIDGVLHTYNAEFRKIRDEKNKYSGAYIKLNDMTLELTKMKDEEYRASHDELTGLANRSYFFEQCEQVIRQNPEVPRYFVATNIKNFKLINDLFGTNFGDNLLKRQADMLNRASYTNCVKGRISGDKFAMLISKKNFNPELAKKNTDFVRDLGQNVSFPLTIQLGIYEIEDTKEKAFTMYNKALLALKNSSDTSSMKCTLSYYDTSIMNKLLNEQTIIGEFKKSLKNNDFHIFIQAQIDCKDDKCHGGEALVRWFDSDSFKKPAEFINILEKSGLIYKLDYFVWEFAAQTLSKWKKSGHEDFYISVNISANDFYYNDLYQVFTKLVEKYDISPANYNLELTESVVIDKNSPHKNIIKRLRDYGFKIEMDDFGSGYSSLNVLKEIEMDVLKIDMGFLHKSENEERGKSIILEIAKMAKALGMNIVAEGVETEEQKNYLKEIGIDILQGYYYSQPLELQKFEEKYLGGIV